ncbi:MAG: helix-hairpin-helix domain-containing protein [Candidatus Bipolaricaulota bacterium]
MTKEQERGLVFLLSAALLLGGAVLLWPSPGRSSIRPASPLVLTGVSVVVPVVCERGKIDVNRAGLEELCRLPGIGEALASRIMAYRTAHGPFQTLDDLTEVSGIGPKTVDGLREMATVGEAP